VISAVDEESQLAPRPREQCIDRSRGRVSTRGHFAAREACAPPPADHAFPRRQLCEELSEKDPSFDLFHGSEWRARARERPVCRRALDSLLELPWSTAAPIGGNMMQRDPGVGAEISDRSRTLSPDDPPARSLHDFGDERVVSERREVTTEQRNECDEQLVDVRVLVGPRGVG
jgi:hypothetical protein